LIPSISLAFNSLTVFRVFLTDLCLAMILET
jgi:hypothetical protein